MLSHLRHQGPVVGSLLLSARDSLFASRGEENVAGAVGTLVEETLPPRPRDLVDAYIRHVGGDPSSYRNVLPPHMFPQWAMPLAAKTLRGANLPLTRVINAGSSIEMRAPLPSNTPLVVRATLERADNDGRRILLEQVVTTGTLEHPNALVARLFAYVPLTPKGASTAATAPSPKKESPRSIVPFEARELARWRLSADAGLKFATLTGDINPIHWSPSYARAFGFKKPILHGFSCMARTIEGLNRALFSGDSRRLLRFSARFVRPLTLPSEVGLYIDGSRAFVGEAPGAAAYLTSEFETVTRVLNESGIKESS